MLLIPTPTTIPTSNTYYLEPIRGIDIQGQETDRKAAGTAPTTTPTRTVARITMMALGTPPTRLLAETRPHSLEAATKSRELK